MRIPRRWRTDDDHHLGPLAEYSALRAEIIHLMDQQWKVTAFLITTSGAVFGFAFTSADRMPLLLIIPFSSNILAARWVLCQRLVERVSLYIRTELDPHVPGGIGYEKWLRKATTEPPGLRRVLRQAQTSPTVLASPRLPCWHSAPSRGGSRSPGTPGPIRRWCRASPRGRSASR
ncbi:hypothetical protein [Amycolatopsis sp. RTGN1]|uniref:hypothetical protein n=1 Tax=Amycolatopsis ponsaeliensis TaxID=2992142 RepID=UPI00254C6A6A|nr:hypothetical protein [Amycolatopsis sp. RTGN1]